MGNNETAATAIWKEVESTGVIAVVTIDNADSAVELGNALVRAGIRHIELTLRTDAAFDAAKRILADVPEIRVGLGTVMRPDQVEKARALGVAFAVSAGCNPRVLEAAKEARLPFAPGIATPSEIESAVQHGCRVLKFFPAEGMGGLSFLKSAAAPYNHLALRYIPLGGINQDNMRRYLDDGLILAVGGSWIAERKLIVAENWGEIERRAAAAVAVARAKRSAAGVQ